MINIKYIVFLTIIWMSNDAFFTYGSSVQYGKQHVGAVDSSGNAHAPSYQQQRYDGKNGYQKSVVAPARNYNHPPPRVPQHGMGMNAPGKYAPHQQIHRQPKQQNLRKPTFSKGARGRGRKGEQGRRRGAKRHHGIKSENMIAVQAAANELSIRGIDPRFAQMAELALERDEEEGRAEVKGEENAFIPGLFKSLILGFNA